MVAGSKNSWKAAKHAKGWLRLIIGSTGEIEKVLTLPEHGVFFHP
ncbi:hypothetical protein PITCH_A410008 [uncultured Desulfobacterium sp.]|uniref:Uncharacterized protein n=1 Tax=uncultured Desulfobacterium sp. TaxID=201089 RepID=A0A445MZX9_9BACT|nr:hypothetical protein PITCH_A410008 [uncultured Desulfobacterium sp.]